MWQVAQHVRVLSFSAALLGTTCIAACSGSSSPPISPSSVGTQASPPASLNASGSAVGNVDLAPKPLATRTTVVIAVPAKVEFLADMQLAAQFGEFAKENLNVKVIVDPGGTNSEPQELAQGLVQMVDTGINASTLNAIHDGLAIRFVGQPYRLAPDDQTGFWVNTKYLNSDGTFNKTAGSGCKVSVGPAGLASVAAPVVQEWLAKSGASLAKLAQVPLPGSASVVTALQNGSICGGEVSAPFWTMLTSDPHFKNVTRLPAAGVLEMYEPWVETHRDVAEAILRAVMMTHRDYLSPGYHKNAAVMKAIADWVGVPVSSLTAGVETSFNTDINPVPVTSDVAQQLQDGWLQIGGILQYDNPQQGDSIVDGSLVTAIGG